MAVTRCPQLEISPDVWDAIEAADFARKGVLPMPGELLNQTASFAWACRRIWNEEDAVRAEMKLEAIDG